VVEVAVVEVAVVEVRGTRSAYLEVDINFKIV
jgi:hypothetical protein